MVNPRDEAGAVTMQHAGYFSFFDEATGESAFLRIVHGPCEIHVADRTGSHDGERFGFLFGECGSGEFAGMSTLGPRAAQEHRCVDAMLGARLPGRIFGAGRLKTVSDDFFHTAGKLSGEGANA